MQVVFKSFGPLRRALGKAELIVEVQRGATVQDVIEKAMDIGGPELRRLMLHGEGLSGNLIVMLNQKDVDTLSGLETPVEQSDTVTVLPHVQGG